MVYTTICTAMDWTAVPSTGRVTASVSVTLTTYVGCKAIDLVGPLGPLRADFCSKDDYLDARRDWLVRGMVG
jgi:hypothetical protein